MNVPEVIPIRHEPDHRTRTIGRWQDGQFFGSVTAAFPEGWSGDDWQVQKRWCAVLHQFDGAGRHLDSLIQFTGTTADGEKKAIAAARQLLAEWLDALPGRQYQDIAIAPFAVRFEGALFGLVLEEGEDEDDEAGDDDVRAEFCPDGLGFYAPWNGDYDT
ncbi:hypothetical protein PYK79_32325 [Streptomyces sp. ID05-04B]|uniref:hypothetical protein n=1 Tax=unclassified Streptomyces TaxID=2593676 RepID=UPI000D1B48A1|nr:MULTISPECIES: hypothetical protein [unclassified Streptomyces]AVV40489.1 hypothetical protein C6376_02660 [Streptomyces sp. P3]MDX5566976.1 hypothetical protein [Streptomyces sp. ID05-04B]